MEGENLIWFGEIERKLAKLSMTTFTYRSSSYLFYGTDTLVLYDWARETYLLSKLLNPSHDRVPLNVPALLTAIRRDECYCTVILGLVSIKYNNPYWTYITCSRN
jgi:hypothetical protein